MRNTRIRPSLAALGLVTIAAATLGAAYSDDSDKASSTSTTAAEASNSDNSATEVNVKALDYKYEGLPDEVAVGTKFTLSNESASELHEMVVFRVKDGENRSIMELLDLPEGETEAALSMPPAAVLLAMPDSDDTIAAVGDGTITEPGRYIVICSIPTGADPGEYMAAAETAGDEAPEVDGGPPHFANGMYAEFTVK